MSTGSPTLSRFSFPTTIHFGAGARKLLAEHLKASGVKRPLVVTDKGVAALPMTADLAADLRGAGLAPEIFGGVFGNPTGGQVKAGVDAYRAHRADGVVGLGGGAALDVAKAVALMAVHEGDILDYAWDHPNARPIQHALPHFVALPTTAGTGSEVGRSSVISHDTTHVKKIVFAPALLAKAVFADPELTLDLPPHITAATGMDALAHNVESYLSPVYHPLCDGIALEGARIAARALRPAVANGKDLAARSDMLMASMMGAIAFQKDLGVVHSCAHALGTVLNVHHGLAIGIMFDHGMRFNAPAAAEKMAELARVTGAGKNAEDFVAWLTKLKADTGIPAKLDQVKATRAHLPKLVELALVDTCHKTNPRPCTQADFEAIFSVAI
ncbi:MAG TPA: iron-containing alcohol dehydrogenase [Opitutaceae bacterium]|nr:iron-containing alcohol dehydrogenase [Opitutaceae bacterium]